MSDDENHVEPPMPNPEDLSNRLFALGMVGVLGFIAVVFIFII